MISVFYQNGREWLYFEDFFSMFCHLIAAYLPGAAFEEILEEKELRHTIVFSEE